MNLNQLILNKGETIMARKITFIEGRQSQNVVLTSKYFDLVAMSGIGMGNVPWTGYDVISKGDADDLVVKISLRQKMWDFDSWEEGDPPVAGEYTSSSIAWGFQSHGDPDPQMMIVVLGEAIEFKKQVDEYLQKEGHSMKDRPYGRPNGNRMIK